MNRRATGALLLLALLWGGSFPFIRVAVPEFGPLPLMALRALIGAAVLVPMLAFSRRLDSLRDRTGHALLVGVINSALPFVLFAWAQQFVPAGLNAILNATTPFWTALVAWAWLGDQLDRRRIAGLVIGFGGVVILAWERASFGAGGSGWAILAALTAALSYGVSGSYMKRFLSGANPLAIATISQLSASALLTPLALLNLPTALPSAKACWAVLMLGVFCTGFAYAIFFWLMEKVGSARATTVTFLVPLFAVTWGSLLLDEQVTWDMVIGGSVILAGTALTLGFSPNLRLPLRRRPNPSAASAAPAAPATSAKS